MSDSKSDSLRDRMIAAMRADLDQEAVLERSSNDYEEFEEEMESVAYEIPSEIEDIITKASREFPQIPDSARWAMRQFWREYRSSPYFRGKKD